MEKNSFQFTIVNAALIGTLEIYQHLEEDRSSFQLLHV